MEDFYRGIDAPAEVFECLAFQRGKFTDAIHERYTHIVRRNYGGGFVKKGMELAKQRQEEALSREDSF